MLNRPALHAVVLATLTVIAACDTREPQPPAPLPVKSAPVAAPPAEPRPVAVEIPIAPPPDNAPKGMRSSGSPLPADGFKCTLESQPLTDSTMRAGSMTKHEYRLTNQSTSAWPHQVDGNAPFYAVNLAYRWYKVKNPKTALQEGPRAYLKEALAPGKASSLSLTIKAPQTPGEYLLRVEPVQEGVAWFKDRGGCDLEATVRVIP